jgi:hypothetical protein
MKHRWIDSLGAIRGSIPIERFYDALFLTCCLALWGGFILLLFWGHPVLREAYGYGN